MISPYLRPLTFIGLAKPVELPERPAQSSPGELDLLLRHLADELLTAKALGGVFKKS
jgi:hypothetical protein